MLGVQVGADNFTVERRQWLVCFPENLRIPLPEPELPMMILNCLAAIAVSFSIYCPDKRLYTATVNTTRKHATVIIPNLPSRQI